MRGLVADVTADVRVSVTQSLYTVAASQYRELSHGNNLITITQFYSNEGIGASLFCLAGFVLAGWWTSPGDVKSAVPSNTLLSYSVQQINK